MPAHASRDRIAPGPPGRFLQGHLIEFKTDVLRLLAEATQEFGDLVRFRLGPRIVHLVNRPDYIEHVLSKNHSNYDRNTRSAAKIRSVCRESLLTTSGEAWRRERRLIQPAFHHERIAGFASLMTEAAAAMLVRWQRYAETGEPFDVASEMSRLTYTIVGKTLFSADVAGDAETVERALAVLLERTYRRIQNPFDLPIQIPWPSNRRFQQALRTIDRVVYRIINERRRKKELGHDLLSMLLEASEEGARGQLSDDQVRNETITLLLSGHETTAKALSWTFYLLSQSPAVEEQLQRELASVLGGRLPVLQDIPALPYTTQVIQESLRLYPPIWILERRAIQRDEIGDCHIPAGSTVVVSPYALHRHPRHWPDPERFDPDRFHPEHPASGSSRAYLPFGAGPHQCIGSNYVMMEARLIVAMVCQNYRLRMAPGRPVIPQPGITLRPRDGLMMRLIPIK